MRQTIAAVAEYHGMGVHGGQPVKLEIRPAKAGTGILFERTDIADGRSREIPARWDLVTDTRLCTKLTNADGVSVATVEHLMAALAGARISDARIRLDGPEVPILDGSARPFLRGIARAGLRRLSGELRPIRILETVEIVAEGKRAALEPCDGFEMDYTIIFADPAIGEQHLAMDLAGNAFAEELCECRTFGHLQEVEALRKMGLARGGSLENAIVIDNGRILNPEGLRRSDEFVRHKMLDAIGDLALAGAPIQGRYMGLRSGHEMTNRLLRALFQRPDAWEWGAPLGREAFPPLTAPQAQEPVTSVAV